MRNTALLFAVATIAASCSPAEPEPEPFDAGRVTAKPVAGAECNTGFGWYGQGACESNAVVLECEGFVFRPYPCRGSQGCQQSTGYFSCDYSGNLVGDPCPVRQDGRGACSVDAGYVVICRDGGITHVPCQGGAACTVADGGALLCR